MSVTRLDRIRDGADIVAVLRGQRQRAGRLVVVHVRARGDAQPSRLAVVASRRVGTAVNRNRAKRLLREAAATLPWRPGFDLVLVARAEAADRSLGDIAQELATLAHQLEALEPAVDAA